MVQSVQRKNREGDFRAQTQRMDDFCAFDVCIAVILETDSITLALARWILNDDGKPQADNHERRDGSYRSNDTLMRESAYSPRKI